MITNFVLETLFDVLQLCRPPRRMKIQSLGRLEGQFVGIAERVPHMQNERERHGAEMAELTWRTSAIKEGLVNMYDFLELRSTVVDMRPKLLVCDKLGLIHRSLPFHVDLLKVADSRCPYILETAALCLVLSCFPERGLRRMMQKTPQLLVNQSVLSVKEWIALDNALGREKVNESIAVWTGLVKEIQRDKTLLDMVITAGSPSEAWKDILSMVGESSKAAQDKVKKKFKELTFAIVKESTRDFVAKEKALVMKLDNTALLHLNKRLTVES